MTNTRAWAIWVAAASLPALFSRNPLYLIVALLAVAVVRSTMPEAGGERSLPVMRFGLVIVVVATVWNALTVHYGQTILFRLPGALPLIGGPVTLEAAVFGFGGGLSVWLLTAAFNTFSAAMTPYRILSLAPRALRHAGLVVSIALTFFPQALRTAREVREAQAVRGYRPRRLRDLTATIVPLLLNTLENAMQLAEAMEARGYGRVGGGRSSAWGWLALLAGALTQLYWSDSIAGWVLIAFGAGWLIVSSRADRATRYRRERWSKTDALVALVLVASATFLLTIAIRDPNALSYYPYPRLTPPPIRAEIVAAMLMLITPALRFPIGRRRAAESLSEF